MFSEKGLNSLAAQSIKEITSEGVTNIFSTKTEKNIIAFWFTGHSG